jgi:hypothetical protein
MRYEIRVQDPTAPPRSALFDVIVEIAQAGDVVYLRLFFGFLTGSGMAALLAVPEVGAMLRTAEVDVLVGVDAVTDRPGLEALLGLEAENANLRARAIKNNTAALIHPKMLFARYADGRSIAMVGSNNLSFGGLTGNVEGYAMGYFERDEEPDLADWDAFVGRWDRLISEIDDEVLASADRNVSRLERLRRAARRVPTPAEAELVISDGQAYEAQPTDADLDELILVSTVPRGGQKKARWSQVHLSAEVLRDFFTLEPDSHALVQLRDVEGGEVEDRQIVYSAKSNKNVKVEVGAAREAAKTVGYPPAEDGRPIVVFRREGTGRYRDLLLMPGDSGHTQITELLEDEFEPKGNQLPRIITPRSHVLTRWPDCPL